MRHVVLRSPRLFMNRRRLKLASLAIFTLMVATLAHAGLNAGAQAWLTWSASGVQSNLTTPSVSSNLYIRVSGAHSFKGAEADLVWNPPGDGEACAVHTNTLYRTGTNCTYLNRGVTVPVVAEDIPGHLHVSWANTLADTLCADGGNIAVLQFEYDGCEDAAGCIALRSLTLLDGNNAQDVVDSLGSTATILDGTAYCDTLSLGAANSPPSIADVPTQQATPGEALTFTGNASDPEGGTVSWTGENLPPGASLDPATGRFAWTPTAAQVGDYSGVTLTATDPLGAAASTDFAIAVHAPGDTTTMTEVLALEVPTASVAVEAADPNVSYDHSDPTVHPAVVAENKISNAGEPIDAELAVARAIPGGQQYALVAQNSAYELYLPPSLTRDARSSGQLAEWGTSGSGGPSDPRCFFDAYCNTWVIVWMETDDTHYSVMHALISKNADPTVTDTRSARSVWTHVFWDARYDVLQGQDKAEWADFPQVGQDAYSIYVSASMHGFKDAQGHVGPFMEMKLWALDKDLLYRSSPDTVHCVSQLYRSIAGDLWPSTMTPVIEQEQKTCEYTLAVTQGLGLTLDIGMLTLSGGSLLYQQTSRGISRTEPTGCASQPPLDDGTTVGIDYAGALFGANVFSRDVRGPGGTLTTKICGVLTDKDVSTGLSRGRVFVVRASDMTILEDVATPTGPGEYGYCPAAMLTADDQLLVTYNKSSATTLRPSLYVAVKQSGQTAFSDGALTVHQGLKGYRAGIASGSTCARWGDYSAMCVDSDGVPWLLGAASSDVFESQPDTWIAEVQAPVGVGAPVAGPPGAPIVVTGAPDTRPRLALVALLGTGVKAEVFNVAGRCVRHLVLSGKAGAEYTWDEKDDTGERVNGGLYFVRLEGGGPKAVARMVIVR